MRELAAQLYALVISTMTGNDLQTSVHNLVKVTKDNHVRHCLRDAFSSFSAFFKTLSDYVFTHHRVLRLSTAPSWLLATWWEGTRARKNVST